MRIAAQTEEETPIFTRIGAKGIRSPNPRENEVEEDNPMVCKVFTTRESIGVGEEGEAREG